MRKGKINVRLEQGMDDSEVVANELLIGNSEIGVGESGNLQGEGNGIERLGALGSRLTRGKEFQGFLDQLELSRQRKEENSRSLALERREYSKPCCNTCPQECL